jgi:hypothetical protein
MGGLGTARLFLLERGSPEPQHERTPIASQIITADKLSDPLQTTNITLIQLAVGNCPLAI